MNRFVFSAVGIALFTVACGSTGSSGSGSKGGGTTNQAATALAYTSPCAPTSCDDKPVADDSGVATCSTGSSGTCGWSPGSPGGAGSSGSSPGGEPGTGVGSGSGTSGSGDPGDGVTSFAPCDASACTGITDIACGPGYQMDPPQCGSLNGGACASIIECSPIITSDGGTCSPDQCGPQLDDARVCDGGVTGTKVCTSTSIGCEWIDDCP